ncbi:Alpha/Beta hydrolase protein [Xylogone sp. PMI_703]|nr:Alpha/Beta hydrolase protein [Xylogone sp. PMI_703]
MSGSLMKRSGHAAGFFDKLDLIPAMVSIISTAIYGVISGPFRGTLGSDTYYHHVTHSVSRKMFTRISTAQLQYLTSPFTTVYTTRCQKKGVNTEIVTLPSGCKAFWVGDKTAKNIVIYFHGGAFVKAGGDMHLDFWDSIREKLHATDDSLAFFYLEYSLVPYETYPRQIKESIEAVNYVLQTLKRSPSEVILAGDSAGGNLALAVLSNVLHPHVELPRLEIDRPFKGMILVSPWIDFKMSHKSAEENRYRDIFTPQIPIARGSDYLGDSPTSEYAEAVTAPAIWWKDAKVEQVLAVVGSHELMRDSIIEWAEKFKSVNDDKLSFVIGEGETHIAPIFEPSLGDKTETIQGKAIASWLRTVL